MPPDVVAFVLLAAILDASWNALLKPVDERLEVFAMGGALLGLPLAAAAPFIVPAGDALPFVAASILLHLASLTRSPRPLAHKPGASSSPLAADVSELDQVEAFVDRAAQELGGIDIVVNNAGATTFGGLLDVPDERWLADIEMKLMSYVRTARAALAHMNDRPPRSIQYCMAEVSD
jgi:NAD(P)-dependent dehydrogenase (short-subunit alcohol dehydrogenase family)